MSKDKFVAVPVELMNGILNYLQEQKYRDVHMLITRISSECTSIEAFSEETQGLGEGLPSVVDE